MTKEVLDAQHIEYEIQCFQNSSDLERELLKAKDRYHLILMDICLGEDNGVQFAKKMRQNGIDTPLIYISGYDTFAMEAIETDVVRYLVKPLDKRKLEEALLTAYRRGYKKDYIILELGAEIGIHKLYYDDILYLEAYSRGTNIITKSDTYHVNQKFSKMAEEISGSVFCRCHHSFIVNKNKVSVLRRYEIVLENEKVIPVSRRRYEQCKKEFLEFLL